MKTFVGALLTTTLIMLLMLLGVYAYIYAQGLDLESRGYPVDSLERECVTGALRGSSVISIQTVMFAVIAGIPCVLLGFVAGMIARAAGQPQAKQVSTARWVAGVLAFLAAGSVGFLSIVFFGVACFVT